MSNLNDLSLRARERNVNRLLVSEYEDFNAFQFWNKKTPKAGRVPKRFNVLNRVVDTADIQPNTGINQTSLLNGGTFEFKLDTNDISVIDHMFLCCNVTNSTGASVTLPPTPFWFERYEIQDDNGSPLCTVTDVENWLSVCMMPKNEFENYASYFGTTSAYSTAGVVIANGASRELYVPLLTFVNAVRLHLPGFVGNLRMKFYPNTSVTNLIAGTHPTFTKVALSLFGFDEDNEKRERRTLEYRNQIIGTQESALKIPFLDWVRIPFATTLTPSLMTSIKLQGSEGQVSGIFVVIRPAVLTAANQGSFIPLDSITVRDQSGTSFCGNMVKSHDRSRIIMMAQLESTAAANVNFYLIPFSSQIPTDFFVGQINGFQIFTGGETLEITPRSSLTPGSYSVEVLLLRPSILNIYRGQSKKEL